jgi:2-dehydro-3-deoxyphosphogluconate aldolase / (4S)-4-hydroxy-2-oxoglutarate aldolase
MADRGVTTTGSAATLAELGRAAVVAIVRTPGPEGVADACRAVAAAGLPCLEITLTVPGALGLIGELADELVIGAGTVLDEDQCRRAIEAGARFVISPGFAPDVVAYARAHDVVAIPGALTPTEVMRCVDAGADVVKLFPARVATPGYLADLAAPLPDVRLMPTGGIDADSARGYLVAGAFAVGIGSALVSPRAVRDRDLASITDVATRLRHVVAEVRGSP